MKFVRTLSSTTSNSLRKQLFRQDDLEIRDSVQKFCRKFPNEYWRNLEKTSSYPTEFVSEMGKMGYLHVLIPTEYGGSGNSLSVACAILEEIHASGGNAGAVHAQMYMLSSIVKYGSDVQKLTYLPKLSTGELRYQAFGITEETGSDTLSLKTQAIKQSDGSYRLKGSKIWTSRALHSDIMLVLARTSTVGGSRSQQLSTFIIDLNKGKQNGTVTINKIDSTINHNTCQVFFDDYIIDPKMELLGKEGEGFFNVLSVMNAERVLIASECIGDGRFFMDRVITHANNRKIFGNILGKNQGVQFPISRAFINLESAALFVKNAAMMWEENQEASGPVCMASKHLASEASWECAEVCLQMLGGLSFDRNSDVERKWRETRLFRIAPISTNLIMAHIGEKVLGLPKSY